MPLMPPQSPGHRMHAPGITQDAATPGQLQTSALKDERNRSAIHTLRNIVITSRGPHGSLKMLHNDVGGHVSLTSTCSRILGGLSVRNPLLKLVVACVKGHVDAYSDGGLFTCGLALSLIQNSLDLDIHPHLITDIYERLLHECTAWLEQPLEPTSTDPEQSQLAACKFKFDTCGLDDMNNLASTMVSSKPGCDLWPGELQHMTSLVVSAFLRTSAESTPHNLQYVCVEGCAPSGSSIVDGMLYPMPSIPPYRSKPISPPSTNGTILVAVFNTSLAGDTSERCQEDLVLSSTSDNGVDGAVLAQLLACCDALAALGVGVLACQRVVHPALKRRLSRRGVIVMDRLGVTHIYTLQHLTGAVLLGNFSEPVRACDLGRLDAVRVCVMEGRSHLHLQRAASSVCTLVIHARSEEALSELKAVCEAAYRALQQAWRDGLALAGGGCWQQALNAHILNKTATSNAAWCNELGCSRVQLTSAVHAFCRALTNNTALPAATQHMTDTARHHRWHSPHTDHSAEWPHSCNCQAVLKTEHTRLVHNNEATSGGVECRRDECVVKARLLDSYSMSLNGLRISVACAVMVLGVHNIIENVN